MSISASVSDYRFILVEHNEMNDISLERSILSKLELVQITSFEDYLTKLTLGVDGVIIGTGTHTGLLLLLLLLLLPQYH